VNLKHRILVGLAVTAVTAGVLVPAGATSRASALLAQLPGFVAMVLLYAWYKADVAQRGVATSTTFNGLVISFSFIALPAYFIRTRGVFRGLGASVGFYAGIFGWMFIAGGTAGLRQGA
jgi:hypothetical protein